MRVIKATGIVCGALLALGACGQEKDQDLASHELAVAQAELVVATPKAVPAPRKLSTAQALAQERAIAPGQVRKDEQPPPRGHLDALLEKIKAENDDQSRKALIIEYVHGANATPPAERGVALAKLEAIWKR